MCAKREPVKDCPRCKDKVIRVEQSGLGSVFMCTHGGSRYNNKGCRRTYLSQRDLQAHINHRHVAVAASANRDSSAPASNAPEKTSSSNVSTISGRNPSTPNASSAGPPLTNSVRTNLMNMQQENLNEDNHYQSRHSRYSNSHYENSGGGGNWSSNNYR